MTDDDAFMVLAGVRYCIGRHTYAPSLCCAWLKRGKWAALKPGDRAVILRDVDEHVRIVESRDGWDAAGWEIDLRTWKSFAAWARSQDTPTDAPVRAEGDRAP